MEPVTLRFWWFSNAWCAGGCRVPAALVILLHCFVVVLLCVAAQSPVSLTALDLFARRSVSHRAVESLISLNDYEIENVTARREVVHAGNEAQHPSKTKSKSGDHEDMDCCSPKSWCPRTGSVFTWSVEGEYVSDGGNLINQTTEDGIEAHDEAAVFVTLRSGHAFGIRATTDTHSKDIFVFASRVNFVANFARTQPAESQHLLSLNPRRHDFDTAVFQKLDRPIG